LRAEVKLTAVLNRTLPNAAGRHTGTWVDALRCVGEIARLTKWALASARRSRSPNSQNENWVCHVDDAFKANSKDPANHNDDTPRQTLFAAAAKYMLRGECTHGGRDRHGRLLTRAPSRFRRKDGPPPIEWMAAAPLHDAPRRPDLPPSGSTRTANRGVGAGRMTHRARKPAGTNRKTSLLPNRRCIKSQLTGKQLLWSDELASDSQRLAVRYNHHRRLG